MKGEKKQGHVSVENLLLPRSGGGGGGCNGRVLPTAGSSGSSGSHGLQRTKVHTSTSAGKGCVLRAGRWAEELPWHRGDVVAKHGRVHARIALGDGGHGAGARAGLSRVPHERAHRGDGRGEARSGLVGAAPQPREVRGPQRAVAGGVERDEPRECARRRCVCKGRERVWSLACLALGEDRADDRGEADDGGDEEFRRVGGRGG